MTAPVVFVSYSHDSQEHKQWVLELATRLRNSGVDAILDQWDIGPGGDLPHFMEQSLGRAARVLMICTDRYVEKANAGAGGVGYEKMIVTADLMKKIESNRIIPVVRQTGVVTLPTFLGSKLYVDLSTSDRFETGMDQLLRDLLNAPLFVKPPIGSAPFQQVANKVVQVEPDPVTRLMTTILRLYSRSSDTGALDASEVRGIMNSSKLLFDYALDQAEKQQLVSLGSSRRTIWVTDTGRAYLLKLPN